jgi:hypothetical protein
MEQITMEPTLINVYMCDDNFYGTFEGLALAIRETYGVTLLYEKYIEGRTLNNEEDVEYYYMGIDIDGKELIEINEYQNQNIKTLSFMKCLGPAAECCFTIPKNKEDFLKEATNYFTLSGFNYVIAQKQNNELYIADEEVGSDLMTFTYIEPILCDI